MLLQGSTQNSHVLHMSCASTGKLPQQLCKGAFAVFKCIPMFDSDFIQISQREVIDVHNSVQMFTVGIAYTSLTSQYLTSCCWHDGLSVVQWGET